MLLGCGSPVCVLCPFLRIEKWSLAKYLPAISGASARQPATHKGRVLRVFAHMGVCASVVFGKMSGCQGVLGLFPSLPCQRTSMCVCVYAGTVVGHDSKEEFRTHGSELNRRPEGEI